MTNREAIAFFKDMNECTYGNLEAVEMAIKALEQELMLDNIRAEIACHIIEDDTSGNTPARIRADWAAANKAHLIDIAILDKYKRESEEEE